MLRTSLCVISSVIVGCACAGGPKMPDANLYRINVSEDGKQAEAYGYNLRNDYGDDGVQKPDAEPKIIPLESLSDLRGWRCVDRAGFEDGKKAVGKARKWIKEHCK